MEQVQQASLRLSEAARARIEGLWDDHTADRLDLDDFRTISAAVIAQLNAAGVQVADVGLTAEVTRQLGVTTEPLGLAPTPVQTDESRIIRDIDRILDRDVDLPDTERVESQRRRLGQWARSEPLLTVASSVQRGMTERQAEGWTRRVDADPCPVCIRWNDGVTRPTTVNMARHPGCACTQQPAFTADSVQPGSTAPFVSFLDELNADVAARTGNTSRELADEVVGGFLTLNN